eukprot:1541005-Amphidinium_carterae.1
MLPGDQSTLRCAAAKALVSVAERGDEAAKAALLERLEADMFPSARSRQSEGNKPHGRRAQQRIKSWWISHPIWGMG